MLSVDRVNQIKAAKRNLCFGTSLRKRSPRAPYMDNARGTTDGNCASCLRPSWSFASGCWSYLAFQRLISASQGARVTDRTILLLIQRCCLKHGICPRYPFTLESHWSNLLLYRCVVRWSTVGNELPQMMKISNDFFLTSNGTNP